MISFKLYKNRLTLNKKNPSQSFIMRCRDASLCLYCVIILLVLGDFWASPILKRDDWYWCYCQVIKYRRSQLVARQLRVSVFIDLGNEIQLVTCLQIQTTDTLYAVNSIGWDLHTTKLMITGWVITFHSRLFPLVFHFTLYPFKGTEAGQ